MITQTPSRLSGQETFRSLLKDVRKGIEVILHSVLIYGLMPIHETDSPYICT